MTFAFTVLGTPQPKGRPRVVRTRGRVIAYTPKATKAYEADVGWQAKIAGAKKLRGPLALTVRFFGTPADGDNLLKAIADGLKGIAFSDDRQIEEWHAYVVRHDEKPRAEIEIRTLEEDAA